MLQAALHTPALQVEVYGALVTDQKTHVCDVAKKRGDAQAAAMKFADDLWFSAEQINLLCTGVGSPCVPCQQIRAPNEDLLIGCIVPFRAQFAWKLGKLIQVKTRHSLYSPFIL